MKNRRVIVIFSDGGYSAGENQPFPPIGTTGTTISNLDEYNEYDIMFDGFPCPTDLPDSSWVTHKRMIVFIDEDIEQDKLEYQKHNKIPINIV